MATVIVEGSNVVVKMSDVEKFEAVHTDVHVPLSAVRSIRVVDDAWIPGVIAVGTRRGSFGKDFAVVHGKEMAVVVDLDGASYSRLVVTTADAENVAAALRGHLMPSFDALPPPS
jgi:hypothetical protein